MFDDPQKELKRLEEELLKKEADDLLEGYTGAALLEVIDLAPPDERGKPKPGKKGKEPATVTEVVNAIYALMPQNPQALPEAEVPNE